MRATRKIRRRAEAAHQCRPVTTQWRAQIRSYVADCQGDLNPRHQLERMMGEIDIVDTLLMAFDEIDRLRELLADESESCERNRTGKRFYPEEPTATAPKVGGA